MRTDESFEGFTQASASGRKDHQRRISLLTALFVVNFVRNIVLDEFYHSSLIAEHPGDNLPRVLKAFRFDNCPSRMDASIAAPFEVMQVSSGMNLFDRLVAILNRVG